MKRGCPADELGHFSIILAIYLILCFQELLEKWFVSTQKFVGT